MFSGQKAPGSEGEREGRLFQLEYNDILCHQRYMTPRCGVADGAHVIDVGLDPARDILSSHSLPLLCIITCAFSGKKLLLF